MVTATGEFIAELEAFAAAQREVDVAGVLVSALARGVWIYGAGGYGLEVRRLVELRGYNCCGFIDRRASDPGFAAKIGARAVTPNDAAQEAKGPLIVGIHNFKDDVVAVVQWARDLGFDPVITAGQLPDLLGKEAGSYWLTTRDVPMGSLGQIGALAECLEDAKSRELLGLLARFRISGDVAHQPPADLSNQYMPDCLPTFPDGLRFIDGGAYDGDTFRAFTRKGVAVADWIAFEPDLANFAALSRTAREASGVRASLYPCGLGDCTEDIGFADGSGAGSHITVGESATSHIRIVAFDEVVSGFSPNFVKLDVEGAEAAALKGMSGTIKRSRPVIAVSVYHTPYDLWEIPTLVSKLLEGAKLYLRQHGYNGFDTVLYAIP